MKLIGVALLFVALAGCGGNVANVPADAGPDSTASADAAPDTSTSCSSTGDCPSCPSEPTPGEACSFPAGVTCPGLLTCNGVLEGGGNVDVQCMGGTWGAVSKDACDPVRCVAGGACSTGICRVPGAGPCGSEEVLACDGGTYAVQSYACTDEGSGCGTTSDGPESCSMSCTCTNGVEACTQSGDCDAG